MKGKWLGIALAAALLSAGCGEGRAIFNVDVLSFIPAPDRDTAYVVPVGPPLSIDFPVQEVTLFQGLENSIVDSVHITGTADLQNATGMGSIAFQVFFDSIQANVYTGSPAISGTGSVSGNATSVLSVDADLAAAFRDFFKQPSVFMGIRVVVSNTGATPLTGRVVTTALDLRLVIQDRVY